MQGGRHVNYELLNLIGYGLAKFDRAFFHEFGFEVKQEFFAYVVACGVAESVGVVKNRQDLFDYFFDNGRRGWWQKGDAYRHRKVHIDALFGDLEVAAFAEVVRFYLGGRAGAGVAAPVASVDSVAPIVASRFRQLQTTGLEAEVYFETHYRSVAAFSGGVLADARLLGDGYDFQVRDGGRYFLAEVKGVREAVGPVRLTEREYEKACEYKDAYGLMVVSGLAAVPRLTPVFNPVAALRLKRCDRECVRTEYHSDSLAW